MKFHQLHKYALKEYMKGAWRGFHENPITQSNVEDNTGLPGFYAEIFWISCASRSLHKNLLAFMKTFIVDKTDKTVKRYISFSRFLPGKLDRLHCDWCSVANGSLEYIKDTLSDHPASICDIKLKYLLRTVIPFYIMTKLKGSAVHKAKCVSFKEAKQYLIVHGNKCPTWRDIFTCKVFLDLHMLVSLIEKRWCPFKHMLSVGYTREYRMENMDAVFEYFIKEGCLSRSSTIDDVNNLFPQYLLAANDSPYTDYIEMFFE